MMKGVLFKHEIRWPGKGGEEGGKEGGEGVGLNTQY